jgi:hypothetical protein
VILDEVSALAAYRSLILHDVDADAELPDGLLSRTAVVRARGLHLVLNAAQDQTPVAVTLETSETAPAPLGQGWEAERVVRLQISTGEVLLEQPTISALGPWQVGAPGRYFVRVAWQGRDAVRERLQTLQEASVDGTIDDETRWQEVARLAGTERYHVTLWR